MPRRSEPRWPGVRPPDELFRFGQAFGPPSSEHEIGARFGEPLRERNTQPRRRTSHVRLIEGFEVIPSARLEWINGLRANVENGVAPTADSAGKP